jgi:cardiolipin synthase
MNTNKFWDSLALIIILLISLVLIASLIQLISGGAILETFSRLTLKVINILFGLSIVLIIIIVVMENGSPSTTMAWILVLIFLPVVGFVFYLFFGRNWRKRRLFGKKSSSDIMLLDHYYRHASPQKPMPGSDSLTDRLSQLLENNGKAVLTTNNSLRLSSDTTEAFSLILQAIDEARHHVHLEYFSIANDETGNQLKDMLIRKAKEGVQIRFIYDDVGCWNLPRSFKRELRKAGIDFIPFSPVWLPLINSRLNYRNHRKLVVVDGIKAYLGGLNIGDRYLGKHHYFGYWRDSLVVINGEAALTLQAIFLTDWLFVSGQNLLQPGQLEFFLPKTADEFDPQIPIQIAASGPDSDQAGILQLYFVAITSAQQSLDISTPYLVLNESLLMALKTAAIGGVKIRILIPSKPDHFMVYWASRSYLHDLLEVGIEIWEYQKGFNHAKLMIVDNEVLLIGTANMDLRSFNHNLELTATVYDRDMSIEASLAFEQDLQHSIRLDDAKFNKRSVVQKSKESLCRLVSPLL